MENVEQTIISQYSNSPTLIRLIQNMNQYIDPSSDFKAFYDYVWNVDTAQGFGLDVWGRIVDIKRELQITEPSSYFGFDDGINKLKKNFGMGTFYNGPPASRTYTLSDDAYRTLIYAKALSNITATTSPAINQLLNNLFANRGRCYVNDMGNMRIRYTFEFTLTPFEESIVNTLNILPHGAGVMLVFMSCPCQCSALKVWAVQTG
jgi:hypothetical protein